MRLNEPFSSIGLMSLSRILTLPTEVRELIYTHVVTEPEGRLVAFRLDALQGQYYNQAVQPALSRVSRQVRSESLPLYYQNNDFVLHTEGTKAEDAYKWLRCNEAYLSSMRRISLWIRYVPLTNNRVSAQGAIGISIYRHRKNENWKIDDDWKWITVVRRPVELNGDVKFLITKLSELVPQISKDDALSDDYVDLIGDLRLLYVQEKMS